MGIFKAYTTEKVFSIKSEKVLSLKHEKREGQNNDLPSLFQLVKLFLGKVAPQQSPPPLHFTNANIILKDKFVKLCFQQLFTNFKLGVNHIYEWTIFLFYVRYS